MMLFKPELISQIVAGKKTQTRRPVSPGETLYPLADHTTDTMAAFLAGRPPRDLSEVLTASGRVKVKVGKSYAVQPGRGKLGAWWHPERGDVVYPQVRADVEHLRSMKGFSPLRIEITDIRMEDVRHISHEDSIAEGFAGCDEFWGVWCKFYDRNAHEQMALLYSQPHATADTLQEYLLTRPDRLYQAWVYTFRIAGES